MIDFQAICGVRPTVNDSGTRDKFRRFGRFGSVGRWGMLLMTGVFCIAGTKAFSQAEAAAKPPPRTNRELRESKRASAVAAETIVVKGVKRVAMGYPRVFTRVFYGGNLVTGAPSNRAVQRARTERGDWLDLNLAEGNGRQGWWTSVLDTGAGGYSMNQETAARFGIGAIWNALFYVQGIDGTVSKGVSPTLTLNIAGANGMLADTPKAPFVYVQDLAQFTIELQPYNPRYNVLPSGMNLIGMPAIRRFTFEIDPSNMKPGVLSKPIDVSSDEAIVASLKTIVAGPVVRIHPTNYRPTNNIVVMPLRYVNYLQMTGADIVASYPVLSTSPMLVGVKTTRADRGFVGNFLLDTGSPVTVISRRHAYQLGLIRSANPSFDQPEFLNSLTSFAGETVAAPGFRVDSIQMRNPAGQIIDWKDVPLLVHDVWVQQLDGSRIVLDGIIGNNLLLPSTDGEFADAGLEISPAPFPKIWIHGPGAELWLERPAVAEPK